LFQVSRLIEISFSPRPHGTRQSLPHINGVDHVVIR